jgi:hypothetical protein
LSLPSNPVVLLTSCLLQSLPTSLFHQELRAVNLSNSDCTGTPSGKEGKEIFEDLGG